MKLQHEQLEDFEPLIQDLYQITFSTEIKRRLITFPSEQAYIESCNSDYNNSQNKIAAEIINLYEFKKSREAELKKLRGDNYLNKESIANLNGLIDVINNRIKVLRRLVDAISLKLFDGHVWMAKRFILHGKIMEPDIPAIKQNIEAANNLNNKAHQHFWLVSDLTTYINVGDLIARYYIGQRFKWIVVELKIGKVNKRLFSIIDSENPISTETTASLNSTTKKQLERIIKQKERTNEILSFINKGKGKDIRKGIPLILNDKNPEWEHYDKELRETIDGAKKEKVSLCIIDECLTVYASTLPDKETFHYLYHMVNPGIECSFKNGWEFDGRHDIGKMQKLLHHPYVKDLILHNINAACHTPFFLLPIEEVLCDLLFGRMRVILYLDIIKFLDLFRYKGYQVELLSKKDTDVSKKTFGNIPLLVGGLINAPQMGVPNLAQAAPIMDRAVPG